jgi:excisionase family DNA binding protein
MAFGKLARTKAHSLQDYKQHAELSAREAADLLNIPYAEIVKAIEAGEIPHRKVGKSFKIKFNDLMAYKETIDRP